MLLHENLAPPWAGTLAEGSGARGVVVERDAHCYSKMLGVP
jgi:hypothetical protein